jgi:hypothetical protein
MKHRTFDFADESLTKDARMARAKAVRQQLNSLYTEANEIYAVIEQLRKELAELRLLHEMQGYDGYEL